MHAGPLEIEIAKLSQKVARNPDSRLFAPLAEAYRKAGRLSEAIQLCERGLRRHPGFLAGSLVLARCYYDDGELDLARVAFQDVLGADSRNLVALRAIGEIAQARGDLDEAASWYSRALEADPGNGEIRERLESLREGSERLPTAELGLAEERPGAAAAEPSVVGDEWEDEPDLGAAAQEIATVTLAGIYVEQGLYERALGVYRKLLAESPEDGQLREKVEQLERRIEDERARLDAEAGSMLGGFVPGDLGLYADAVGGGVAATREAGPEGVGRLAGEAGRAAPFRVAGVDASRKEAVAAAEMRAAAGPHAREASAEAAARDLTGGSEGSPAWAFLLEDEPEYDVDEVFRSSGGGGEIAGVSPLLQEDDLKRFREWLRSLK